MLKEIFTKNEKFRLQFQKLIEWIYSSLSETSSLRPEIMKEPELFESCKAQKFEQKVCSALSQTKGFEGLFVMFTKFLNAFKCRPNFFEQAENRVRYI